MRSLLVVVGLLACRGAGPDAPTDAGLPPDAAPGTIEMTWSFLDAGANPVSCPATVDVVELEIINLYAQVGECFYPHDDTVSLTSAPCVAGRISGQARHDAGQLCLSKTGFRAVLRARSTIGPAYAESQQFITVNNGDAHHMHRDLPSDPRGYIRLEYS